MMAWDHMSRCRLYYLQAFFLLKKILCFLKTQGMKEAFDKENGEKKKSQKVTCTNKKQR